ncbi:hypothetical protein ABZP36_005276 [Zizania latifolia]
MTKHQRDGEVMSLSLSLSLSAGCAEGGERKKPRRSSSPTGPGGEFVCKTCGRAFPSFQALGGHRTSHLRGRHGLALGLAAAGEKVRMPCSRWWSDKVGPRDLTASFPAPRTAAATQSTTTTSPSAPPPSPPPPPPPPPPPAPPPRDCRRQEQGGVRLYASSNEGFKKELDGVQIDLQATDPSEHTLDVLEDPNYMASQLQSGAACTTQVSLDYNIMVQE